MITEKALLGPAYEMNKEESKEEWKKKMKKKKKKPLNLKL